MHGDGLGVGGRRRLEHARKPAVVPAQGRLGKQRDNGLANPIVDGLDDLAPVAQTRPHEAANRQRGDELLGLRELGGVPDGRDRERSSGDGDELHQAPGVGGEGR